MAIIGEYTPVIADATSVTEELQKRLNIVLSASTPGLPNVPVNADARTVSFIDTLMCSRGLQTNDVQVASADSTSSGTFVTITGYPTLNAAITVAKTYEVEVAFSMYASVAPAKATVQLVVGGVEQATNAENDFYFNLADVHMQLRFVTLVTFGSGAENLNFAYTLKWKTTTGTLNVNTDDFRAYRIRG